MDVSYSCKGKITVHHPGRDVRLGVNLPGTLTFNKERRCGRWSMLVDRKNYSVQSYSLNRFTLMRLPENIKRQCFDGKFSIPLTNSVVVEWKGDPHDPENNNLNTIVNLLLEIKHSPLRYTVGNRRRPFSLSSEWKFSSENVRTVYDEEDSLNF